MNDAETLEIAEKINQALARHLRVARERIRPESLLREDLGLDSADTIELVFKLEDLFHIQVPDDDLEKFKKVSDLTAYLAQKTQVV